MQSCVKILTVSDLHQSRRLLLDLENAVERHRPDLVAVVGDFLDMSCGDGETDDQMSKAGCARILSGLSCPEVVLRDDGGNGDLGYPWAVPAGKNKVLIVYYFNKQNGNRHIAGTICEVCK